MNTRKPIAGPAQRSVRKPPTRTNTPNRQTTRREPVDGELDHVRAKDSHDGRQDDQGYPPPAFALADFAEWFTPQVQQEQPRTGESSSRGCTWENPMHLPCQRWCSSSKPPRSTVRTAIRIQDVCCRSCRREVEGASVTRVPFRDQEFPRCETSCLMRKPYVFRPEVGFRQHRRIGHQAIRPRG